MTCQSEGDATSSGVGDATPQGEGDATPQCQGDGDGDAARLNFTHRATLGGGDDADQK